MKRRISINITIDSETAYVTDFDITEGTSRTEFVLDGVDDPISINKMEETLHFALCDYMDAD